jgi:HSP20 family protein
MARRRGPDPVASQVNEAMQQLVSQAFGRFCPAEAWSPNVNVYQLPGRLVVCADLAGVSRDQLEVRIEPGRLEIRGDRPAPEPAAGQPPQRILTMEIDDGQFRRIIRIPETVALDEVTSSYHDGMLWVVLPIRE